MDENQLKAIRVVIFGAIVICSVLSFNALAKIGIIANHGSSYWKDSFIEETLKELAIKEAKKIKDGGE